MASEGGSPMPKGVFSEWDKDQVVQFLEHIGMQEYGDKFKSNSILGKHLTQLSTQDIKESLNITCLGDRLALGKEIQKLKTKEKQQNRKTPMMDVKQAWNGSCFDQSFQHCCGLLPWDPDRYILFPSNLRIKSYEFYRFCNMCKCVCCGGTWKSDNIPLHKIADMDIKKYTVGALCFREEKLMLSITTTAGTEAEGETARTQETQMIFDTEEGEEFEKQLRAAREAHKEVVGLQGKLD